MKRIAFHVNRDKPEADTMRKRLSDFAAGIGLSVVRAIAEAHRGSAHAKSPDGKTMEFTIRLN